jgi:predicted transglutaminase-like cysteine proteinase
MGPIFPRRARPFVILILVLAATAVATSYGQMLRLDAIPLALMNRNAEPFNLASKMAPAGPLWMKWRGFDDGLVKDTDMLARCRADAGSCTEGAISLLALIEEARTLSGRRQLGIINRAVNLMIAYASDHRTYGANDYWSSPLTTFERGRGDCEDYAIAKFFVLREAGIPADDLRMLLARVRSDGSAHAVVAVRHEGRWLLLDNRRMALVDTEFARDLVPLFALDTQGVKQFDVPGVVVASLRRDLRLVSNDVPMQDNLRLSVEQ